jgi:hypothetical protein
LEETKREREVDTFLSYEQKIKIKNTKNIIFRNTNKNQLENR